jgi:hypothetical protein
VSLPADEEIRQRLTAILASPEFQSPEDPAWLRALKKIWHALVAWLEHVPAVGRWAIVVGCVLALVGLGYYVFVTFRRLLREAPQTRHGRAGEIEGARIPTCEELLADAISYKSQARLREAARALQQARLLLECQRQSVAWRPTLADWEWIDRLGRPTALVEFTRATQKVAFGSDPTVPALEACEARLRAELGGPAA